MFIYNLLLIFISIIELSQYTFHEFQNTDSPLNHVTQKTRETIKSAATEPKRRGILAAKIKKERKKGRS